MTFPQGLPPTCPRHPERIAMVRCQRCDRPTCPDCQIPAAVGIQCIDCVRSDPQRAPLRSALGAPLRGGKPMATMTLIGLCVAVYLVQSLTSATATFGGQCVELLRVMGAGHGLTDILGYVPICAPDEPWRLITAAFLHGGVLHLAMNCYALWVVGSFLEQMIGRWRFTALFLLSAVGGSVAVDAYARLGSDPVAWFIPTVGASGGVFGLFGAMVWVVRRIGANMTGVLSVIGLNVVFSFTVASVSWQGHMGGLAVGLALGAAYAFAPAARRRLYGIGATLGAGVILTALVAWLRGKGIDT
ncbi:MAG: rhomboid family intramembrane serine protease [Micrococcales bacterium]|nr:rhomboid family intramembrane serine protease [Micrococcales bacterium]